MKRAHVRGAWRCSGNAREAFGSLMAIPDPISGRRGQSSQGGSLASVYPPKFQPIGTLKIADMMSGGGRAALPHGSPSVNVCILASLLRGEACPYPIRQRQHRLGNVYHRSVDFLNLIPSPLATSIALLLRNPKELEVATLAVSVSEIYFGSRLRTTRRGWLVIHGRCHSQRHALII